MEEVTKEKVLEELNKQLDLGHEVGIFKCKGHDVENKVCTTYDLIIDGHGQNPIISNINKEIFLELYQYGYLLYPQCTKCGEHWYYDFNKDTKNGFTLYQFYTLDDFPFLKDKKFYIVPYGKSKVYHMKKDQYTKIKEHATIYILQTLFDAYMYSPNHFSTLYYYRHYETVGWNLVEREFVTIGNGYITIENKNKEIMYHDNYCRSFQLVTIDGLERYTMNYMFEQEERSIGNLNDQEKTKTIQDKLLHDSTKFRVTFNIAHGGSIWNSYIYEKATYLQRRDDKKPFEEIEKEVV